MLTVGIVGDNEYNTFKKTVRETLNLVKLEKEPNADIIVLINSQPEFSLINNKSILLLNTDHQNFNIETGNCVCTITFGLNSHATITTSSTMEDGTTVVCLQRKIEDCFGRIIEPQEFILHLGAHDLSTTLGIFSTFLVSGKINVLKFLSF